MLARLPFPVERAPEEMDPLFGMGEAGGERGGGERAHALDDEEDEHDHTRPWMSGAVMDIHGPEPSTGSARNGKPSARGEEREKAGDARTVVLPFPAFEEFAALPGGHAVEEAIGVKDATSRTGGEPEEGAIAMPEFLTDSWGEAPPVVKSLEDLLPTSGGESKPPARGPEKALPTGGGKVAPAGCKGPEDMALRMGK